MQQRHDVRLAATALSEKDERPALRAGGNSGKCPLHVTGRVRDAQKLVGISLRPSRALAVAQLDRCTPHVRFAELIAKLKGQIGGHIVTIAVPSSKLPQLCVKIDVPLENQMLTEEDSIFEGSETCIVAELKNRHIR
jgi:hypothetical protein